MHTQSTAAATAAMPPHNKRRLGRSRTTNNPSFLPRKPLSPFQAARRQRDLVEAFVNALGGSVTELVAVQIRKCAELLTMAEGIRAGALGGTPQTSGDLMALIRIEGEARRCLKTLGQGRAGTEAVRRLNDCQGALGRAASARASQEGHGGNHREGHGGAVR